MNYSEHINALEKRIEELSKEIFYLDKRCRRLSRSKITKEEDQHDKWIFDNANEEQNLCLRSVLSFLNSKFEGLNSTEDEKHRCLKRIQSLKAYKENQKDESVAEATQSILYKDGMPEYADFQKLLGVILYKDITVLSNSESEDEQKAIEQAKPHNEKAIDKMAQEFLHIEIVQLNRNGGSFKGLCERLLSECLQRHF